MGCGHRLDAGRGQREATHPPAGVLGQDRSPGRSAAGGAPKGDGVPRPEVQHRLRAGPAPGPRKMPFARWPPGVHWPWWACSALHWPVWDLVGGGGGGRWQCKSSVGSPPATISPSPLPTAVGRSCHFPRIFSFPDTQAGKWDWAPPGSRVSAQPWALPWLQAPQASGPSSGRGVDLGRAPPLRPPGPVGRTGRVGGGGSPAGSGTPGTHICQLPSANSPAESLLPGVQV